MPTLAMMSWPKVRLTRRLAVMVSGSPCSGSIQSVIGTLAQQRDSPRRIGSSMTSLTSPALGAVRKIDSGLHCGKLSCPVQEVSYCGDFGVWLQLVVEVAEITESGS
jgi:hypothetical protein